MNRQHLGVPGAAIGWQCAVCSAQEAPRAGPRFSACCGARIPSAGSPEGHACPCPKGAVSLPRLCSHRHPFLRHGACPGRFGVTSQLHSKFWHPDDCLAHSPSQLSKYCSSGPAMLQQDIFSITLYPKTSPASLPSSAAKSRPLFLCLHSFLQVSSACDTVANSCFGNSNGTTHHAASVCSADHS